MPRIRNNNASAAAVFDTASVAHTQAAAAVSDTAAAATQRGPLHTASQGPLSPATMGVFDTSIAARRVTVSDTVAPVATQAVAVSDTAAAAASRRRVAVSDTATSTVLPPSCLKKTLQYSSSRPSKAQLQSTLRAIAKEDDWNALQQNVASATATMEKRDKALFDKVTRVYRFSNQRKALENALAEYAVDNKAKWGAMWQVIWDTYCDKKASRDARVAQVKAHYEDLETVLAESDDSTAKVSFASATVKEYVLTEWERVHVKLGKARRDFQLLYELPWEPHAKYDSFAPVPSQSIKRGGYSATVKGDLDDYSKRQLMLATRDWVRHGNVEALELVKNPLPHVAFVVSVFETPAQSQSQSTQPNDVVDTSSAVARPSTVVVSDTTTAAAAAAVQSTVTVPVVSDTTAAAAAAAAAAVQSTATVPVVSDTTATAAAAAAVVQSTATVPVVSDTTAGETAAPPQPHVLRRSARIAAQNRTRVAAASGSVRRTSRKGAAKPIGFYKV